jgi:GNAT superfamily N-acetyltransferase
VLVLAVLPEYEGHGIGTRLLSHAVAWLRAMGFQRPWLTVSPDLRIRTHGFYRALGWQPTGRPLDNGDEILILDPDNAHKPQRQDADS